jgi:hypothetical protein
MKKSTLAIGIAVSLVVIAGIVMLVTKRKAGPSQVVDNTEIDLPINTIPLSERPVITLRPDSTGRSLDISLSQAPSEGELEYEMIYNASGKQEGALGSIFLSSEKQPIVKSILLGSKSGGGKITYHEGVTGGSITVTYGETRLKESWNYLHFDPTDPVISSTDAKFHVTLPKTALKKDAVVVTMKTFGYPAMEGKVIAGPYGYFAEAEIKGSSQVELKLPAGEHVNPTIYEYSGTALPAQAGWKKLSTKLTGDTVSATATGSIFVVTAD